MANDYSVSLRLKAAVEGLREITKLVSEIQEMGGEAGTAGKAAQDLGNRLDRLTKQRELIDNFRRLKTETTQTGTALEEAQREAQRLGRELANTDKPTKTLRDNFDRARRTVQQLKEQQQQQTLALQQQRRALSDAGISASNLGQAYAKTARDIDNTEFEVAQLTTKLRETHAETRKKFDDPSKTLRDGLKGTGKEAEGLGSRLGTLARRVGAFIGVSLGFETVRRSIAGVINTGGQFESLRVRLDALTGSAEKGQEAFEWIEEFAQRTPIGLNGVSEAFARLKAFGIDPMNGSLEALIDQNAKLGGSQETLEGIILAVGQAWSKQKLQGEEILQLVERGVPVWDLLTEATGKSVQELQKLSSAGELGRREITLLIEQMGKASKGAAAAQMDTWAGLIQQLRSLWAQFVTEIADQGVLEYAKEQVRELIAYIKAAAANGDLQRWAKTIADAMVGAMNALRTFVTTLYEWRDAIILAAKATAAWQLTNLANNVLRLAGNMREKLVPAIKEFVTSAHQGTGPLTTFRNLIRSIPTSVKVAIAVVGYELLKQAGEWIGEAAARLAGADDEIARIQERNRERAREEVIQAQILRAQWAAYKDTILLTAEEVANLSDTEREAYRRRLEGLQQYQAAQHKELLWMQQLGEENEEQAAKIREQLAATREAFQALENGSRLAATAIRNELTPGAQKLIEAFRATIDAGEGVEKALENAFSGFDPSRFTAVRDLVQALGELRKESSLLDREIEEGLRKTLREMSTQDLMLFQTNARAAFAGTADEARKLAGIMEVTLNAALERLGLDLERFKTGMTTAGKTAIDTFQIIVDTGRASSEQIRAALQAAADAVTTDEGVRNLRAVADQAIAQNKISAQEAKKIIDGIVTETQAAAERMAQSFQNAIRAAADQGAVRTALNEVNQAYREGNITLEQRTALLEAARAKELELAEAAKASAAAQEQAGAAATTSATISEEGADRIAGALQGVVNAALGVRNAIGGMGAVIANAFTGWAKSLHELSEAAHDAFLVAMDVGAPARGTDELRAKIDSLNESIRRSEHHALMSANSISRYFSELAINANRIKVEFYEQQLAVEELTESIANGTIPTTQLLRLDAERLRDQFDLLGDQQLNGLISALEAAQSRVESLRASAESTLRSIQQELAELEGRYEDVADLQAEQRRAQLEQQLREAEAIGDQKAISDLQQALRTLDEVSRHRMEEARQREREERERAQAEREAAERERQERQRLEAERQQPSGGSTGATSRQEIVIRLPSGGTIQLEGDAGSAEALLELLEMAGMRANAG